jgi:acyl transferase domain-containing protein
VSARLLLLSERLSCDGLHSRYFPASLKGANHASSAATISGRLSYFYNLLGPSQVTETACSGGLTAFHEATEYLRHDDQAYAALVGASTTNLFPESLAFLYSAGLLSPHARCAAFSKKADGYVQSEGAIALLLTRRSIALRDGLNIHAEILSTTAMHAGRTLGLMRPSLDSQLRLLQKSLHRAGISPDQVDFYERE